MPLSQNNPQYRISCPAPAKINLALHVTGQRDSGHHVLDSLVVFAEPGDHVSASRADNPTSKTTLTIGGSCSDALAIDEDNLVLAAARTINADGLAFHLEKNLPVASGIGGGSADAAAALLCVSKLGADASIQELFAIAADLGADVPMCLYSSPLIARGIGEDIDLLADFPKLEMILINPLKPVSTPQVFSRLENKRNREMEPLPEGLDFQTLIEWLKCQRNDLEPPAVGLVPEITEVIAALTGSGATFARMSGSGATCYGLYENKSEAQTAVQAIRSAHPQWWVQAVSTASFGLDRCEYQPINETTSHEPN